MIKRITSILLMACLCMTALTGCKSDAPAPAAASNNSTVQDGAQKILGFVGDATLPSTEEEQRTLCESCGLDFEDYTTWIWAASDKEFAAGDAIDLALQGCTTIIFAVKGSEQIADQFSLEHPNIQVVVADIAKTADAVEPIIENSYTIYEYLTEFVNNRAWVTYVNSDNQLCYGVIDTNFFIVYSVSQQALYDHGWTDSFVDICVSDFTDGIACIYPDHGNKGRNVSGMIVVDSLGNIVFNSIEADDGYEYYYLGHGDGTILAVEKYSDFSTEASYQICEIDYTGEITYKIEYPYDWQHYPREDFKYCGEGVFLGSIAKGYKYGSTIVHGTEMYNRDTHSLIETYDKVEGTRSGYSTYGVWIYDVQDGNFLCGHNTDYESDSNTGKDVEGKLYFIPQNYMLDQARWNELSLESCFVGEFSSFDISEGRMINSTGVYDYTGQQIAAYPDGWNVIWDEGYSNGYAVICLQGADNKTYVTILDTDGTPQYDPIKCDKYNKTWQGNNGDTYYASWHGYISVVIDGETKIIDPTGAAISETELIKIKKEVDGNTIKRLYDSWYNKYVAFTDLDGNKFTVVYDVSNYDEIADQDYSQVPGGAPEGSMPAVSKDYISVSNFSIDGKWKNIGTYTFGQVQSGAIVAFDGVNCNFYSPKDTYAFYQDGDNYKLECTSLLAETLSFTVKIVDENNIDIFNGSNILELTRVE